MTATQEQVGRCTTHHRACDCREELVRAVVEALVGTLDYCPRCRGEGYEGYESECVLCAPARAALRAYRGEDSDAD